MDDAAGTNAYGGGFEFRDGTRQAAEYAYDANGNLVKDLNKNVLSVGYNSLNLPCKVLSVDGGSITHVYGPDGTKLRTVRDIEGTTRTTDYCGNVVYENDSPKLLLTEEGYVTLSDRRYHYYLKDHQGNNRVVLGENGTVEEVNHYYPFGGLFAGTESVQPYKYNGKEFEESGGLDWYDYGARWYDAALGRFTTVDPMADVTSSIAGYSYVLNNPTKYIDPTGRLVNPIYNPEGELLGTDDEGLQGEAIIMSEDNFEQGMSHENALIYDLGYDGFTNDEAQSKYEMSYNKLSERPDYDGFVTIEEGVAWAKDHPNALDNPTPENSLYINAELLDFGNLSVRDIGINNVGKTVPVNLFTKRNTFEAVYNPILRSTVYALGRVDVILQNPVLRTISIVNNEATDYDWNRGGHFVRNAAITYERMRAGLNDSHGFKVYYYGFGKLRD